MSSNYLGATLVSSDGIEVHATYEAVRQSITLRTMLEVLDAEHTTDKPIPVPGVTGETLKKVLEWCEFHWADQVQPDDKKTTQSVLTEIPDLDAEYFRMDKDMIIQVANAADYLDIPLLLQYAVYVIANHLKGKSTEEMCEFLNIESDFTPEERAKIQEENAWAYS
ncbi:Skp1 family, dimerization domain-containing protein [Xylaria flabelliformis]|nr:Skp1 family, dimerization domain-containing protein [Xylaria flabelliformis]